MSTCGQAWRWKMGGTQGWKSLEEERCRKENKSFSFKIYVPSRVVVIACSVVDSEYFDRFGAPSAPNYSLSVLQLPLLSFYPSLLSSLLPVFLSSFLPFSSFHFMLLLPFTSLFSPPPLTLPLPPALLSIHLVIIMHYAHRPCQ